MGINPKLRLIKNLIQRNTIARELQQRKNQETAIAIKELDNGADQGRKPQENHLHAPTRPQLNKAKGGQIVKRRKSQIIKYLETSKNR